MERNSVVRYVRVNLDLHWCNNTGFGSSFSSLLAKVFKYGMFESSPGCVCIYIYILNKARTGLLIKSWHLFCQFFTVAMKFLLIRYMLISFLV